MNDPIVLEKIAQVRAVLTIGVWNQDAEGGMKLTDYPNPYKGPMPLTIPFGGVTP